MCGRFAFYSPAEAITRLFGVQGAAGVEPRWNIAPTTYVPVVRLDDAGARRLSMLYWGLIPHWAKEKSIGVRMINARAETLAEKPSFRTAYKRRRCLLLADGWYEWKTEGGAKQPYFIHAANGEPFAMAGLWESWVETPGEPALESCAIVTTEAAGSLADIHHRMPVVLDAGGFSTWLDCSAPVASAANAAAVAALLTAAPEGRMQVRRVSRKVNNARNEGPELLQAAD
jgi:putative SOS response-associated peptidase YedK